jgi:hypothetical protein
VANLSHKVTNYGCLQLVAQYIHDTDRLVHYGGQLMVGFADVKDYDKPKSGLFDNFMNTGGDSFFLVEPRLQAELNITRSEKILLGLGYSFAFGVDSQDQNLQTSRITNKDLSGVMVTMGVKFGAY